MSLAIEHFELAVDAGAQYGQLITSDDVFRIRDELIKEASDVRPITCQTERQIVSDILSSVSTYLSWAEKGRVKAKAPSLKKCQEVDKRHELVVDSLPDVKEMLRRKLADFDNAERKKAESEAKRLRDEAARVENERQKAIQDARKAETEAQRAEQLKLAESLQAQSKAAQAAVVATPPKPAGVSSRKVWRFTVTDIKALYAAKPELCEVTHSQSRINAAIAGGMRECAGLSIYEDTQINTR